MNYRIYWIGLCSLAMIMAADIADGAERITIKPKAPVTCQIALVSGPTK